MELLNYLEDCYLGSFSSNSEYLDYLWDKLFGDLGLISESLFYLREINGRSI